MKVVAVKKGFDGLSIREEGEVFEYEGDAEITDSSWMQPADGKKKITEPKKHGEAVETVDPDHSSEEAKSKKKKGLF